MRCEIFSWVSSCLAIASSLASRRVSYEHPAAALLNVRRRLSIPGFYGEFVNEITRVSSQDEKSKKEPPKNLCPSHFHQHSNEFRLISPHRLLLTKQFPAQKWPKLRNFFFDLSPVSLPHYIFKRGRATCDCESCKLNRHVHWATWLIAVSPRHLIFIFNYSPIVARDNVSGIIMQFASFHYLPLGHVTTQIYLSTLAR